jgi:4-diphosphocytidyl-2-C-methyl-D-erythritol kinase
MLQSRAPAKVNLYLHVTGKREDGYHLLDSLAVFPNVADEVGVTGSGDDLELAEITGEFGGLLTDGPDNLMLRAARALAQSAGIPALARLYLTKNLPIASGIGGGSADAAATLRLLCRHWRLDVPLSEVALSLGADVPVCLDRRPARMRGIGEILSPSPVLPNFGMVLVNPGVQVPTAGVFRARIGGFSPAANLPAAWPDAAAMAEALAGLNNDLEAPAIALAPRIAAVLSELRALPGILLARMSGSGATCFGIFATASEAADAAPLLRRPGWWCWGGGLYEPGPARL